MVSPASSSSHCVTRADVFEVHASEDFFDFGLEDFFEYLGLFFLVHQVDLFLAEDVLDDAALDLVAALRPAHTCSSIA